LWTPWRSAPWATCSAWASPWACAPPATSRSVISTHPPPLLDPGSHLALQLPMSDPSNGLLVGCASAWRHRRRGTAAACAAPSSL
jgi:hypothetical protein